MGRHPIAATKGLDGDLAPGRCDPHASAETGRRGQGIANNIKRFEIGRRDGVHHSCGREAERVAMNRGVPVCDVVAGCDLRGRAEGQRDRRAVEGKIGLDVGIVPGDEWLLERACGRAVSRGPCISSRGVMEHVEDIIGRRDAASRRDQIRLQCPQKRDAAKRFRNLVLDRSDGVIGVGGDAARLRPGVIIGVVETDRRVRGEAGRIQAQLIGFRHREEKLAAVGRIGGGEIFGEQGGRRLLDRGRGGRAVDRWIAL